MRRVTSEEREVELDHVVGPLVEVEQVCADAGVLPRLVEVLLHHAQELGALGEGARLPGEQRAGESGSAKSYHTSIYLIKQQHQGSVEDLLAVTTVLLDYGL